MANRTVTYTIKLISDIARQARTDATAIEGANQRQSRSYQSMANSINRTDAVARKLRATALQTNTALQNMGNGVGARMARQFDATIAKLKEIKQLGGDVGGKLLKGGAMAVAGTVAGVKTADMITQKPIDYESRVSRMAQTAYGGRNLGEFNAVKDKITEGVRAATDATKGGGGSRDDAAEALNNMVASGYKLEDAIASLPTIMRTASASGANAKDLTDIVIKGVQNGFIENTPEAIGLALDKAMAAGQSGQFELPDMAKWLAQQFGAGKLAGLSGSKGYDRLLAMNQAAMINAGSRDEAGNNVVNLLAKLNSKDTATDFKKQGFGDLSTYLIDAQKKGGDSVDAWVALLKNEMGKNKDYQSAQKQLASAQTPEQQKQALESITNLAMGTNVGKFFQDRQAIMALLPLLDDKSGVMQKVVDSVNNAQGTVDFGYQANAQTTQFKKEQAGNTTDNAVTDSFTQLKPAIDNVIDGFNNLAHAFPGGAAAAAGIAGVGSVVGSTVMGASGLAYLYDWVGKRKGKSPAPLPGTGGIHGEKAAPKPRARDALGVPLGAPAAEAAVGRWGKMATTLGRMGRVAGTAGLLASVATPVLGMVAGEDSKVARYGGAAINGAALGATLGSIVPGLGTAIGAAIGGAGGLLVESIRSHMEPPKPPPPPEYLTNPVLNQAPINLPPQEVSVKMQDGTLKVQVQVSPTSELLNATARVDQPLFPLQLADGGATNPGNYGGGYRGPR